MFLVWLADQPSDETTAIATAAGAEGVECISVPTASLGGLNPKFARLTLDLALPPDVEDILYVDGDTQIVGDLSPLLAADLGIMTALAARDPMVFIRRVHPRLRHSIDSWWDESGIDTTGRTNYVNSGVLRTTTGALRDLRLRLLRQDSRLGSLRFHDQDAINIAWAGHIGLVSIAWNFPAFMLRTVAAGSVQPRVVHFMSAPRPWESALPPWGDDMHAPYAELVTDYPQLAPYWRKHSASRRLRYRLQQFMKASTEWKSYGTPRSAAEFAALESGTLLRG